MSIPTTYVYKPVLFFLITLLGTWFFGFTAAFLSNQPGKEKLQFFCIILSVLVPSIVALSLIFGSKNQELVNDFWSRLFLFKISGTSLLFILFIMPTVLFLATAISLFFGESAEQFTLANEYSVIKGWSLLGLIIAFILAPLLEEIGWRGYGVDSLRVHFNLLTTSILFAFLWGIWHLPLFFIKGYYHHELWNLGLVYVLNFFVGMLPVAILTNWVFYANNRSIPSVVLFHSMLNIFSVIFKTEQFTKCIVTLLLCVVAAIIVLMNERFFYGIDR